MVNKLRGSDNNFKPGVGSSVSFIDFDLSWRGFPEIDWGGILDWFDLK